MFLHYRRYIFFNLFNVERRDSGIYIAFEVIVLFNPQYILNTIKLIPCYINEILVVLHFLLPLYPHWPIFIVQIIFFLSYLIAFIFCLDIQFCFFIQMSLILNCNHFTMSPLFTLLDFDSIIDGLYFIMELLI